MTKLIIWDLDETVWKGTFAEGGVKELRHHVIDFIKETEAGGILHSICSNNNYTKIKNYLSGLGIWNLFVFPSIDFTPKGQRIKEIIKNANLREVDVVFVDDNLINLNEAKFYSPDLQIYNNPDLLIENFKYSPSCSRTEKYKIIESKLKDINNEDFLKNSNITIAFAQDTEIYPYAKRVEELVNRSNILNYTKSRFTHIPPSVLIADNLQNSFSVFAWDKYGYYGLIGYFSINWGEHASGLFAIPRINCFVFSCRVMNMGIEEYCANYIKNVLNVKKNTYIESRPIDYITLVDFESAKTFINEKENVVTEPPIARIMCVCASPVYWDLMGQPNNVEYDLSQVVHDYVTNEPAFTVEKFVLGLVNKDRLPKLLIIGTYLEFMWYDTHWGTFDNSIESMINAIQTFTQWIRDTDRKVLLILPDSTNLDLFNKDFRDNQMNKEIWALYEHWLTEVDDIHIYKSIICDIMDLHTFRRDMDGLRGVASSIEEWITSISYNK